MLIQKPRKGRRHRLEILRYEYAIVTGSKLQHFEVLQTSESRVFSRSKVDLRLSPLDADNNELIQISVRLKTDFHGFDVCLWRI